MTSPFLLTRRARAKTAIDAHRDATGSAAYDEALIDLLTDIMHWSDGNGLDFQEALDHARFHLEHEQPAIEREFRVTFADRTTWEVFVKAASADAAIEIAQRKWNSGGTDGFTDEDRLDIVPRDSGDCDWRASEVCP